MKQFFFKQFFLLIAAMMAIPAFTQTKQYVVDFKDPKSVVGAIFYAAQTKDFKLLESLPDPLGKSDGDVQKLTSIAELEKQVKDYGANDNVQIEIDGFISAFQTGRVTGKVTYGKEGNVETAYVPFYFSSSKGENRSTETMVLIKREGNWYLYSF